MFQTKAVEKNQTLNLQLLISQDREIYEIGWKNMVQPDRVHMTSIIKYRRDGICTPDNQAKNTDTDNT
jgi:hypothetical protein